MTTVWFIRHGESESNANLVTKHPELTELTPKGFQDADKVVHAFTKKPDLIVVSPYVRARQTAVATINHFSPIPVEEWPVYEFTYLHPERYNGTRGTDRQHLAQAYWQRNDPLENEAGGGESFAELMARVQTLIETLQTHPASFIALFSHGLFLRALEWRLITGVTTPTTAAMRRYWHFIRAVRMPNGAILKMDFGRDKPIRFAGFDMAHMVEND